METSEEHYKEKHASIVSTTIITRVHWACPKCGKITLKDIKDYTIVKTYYDRCLKCSQYITLGVDPLFLKELQEFNHENK